jgi:phosphatidylglycerol---prolipoprotein diacylglyceryl transferase
MKVLGPLLLGWHGLFTALAVLVAIQLAAVLGKRQGVDPEAIYAIAGWGVVSGIAGARLFHVADHLPYYLANPLLIPAVWVPAVSEGGIAIDGAFLGGLIGGVIAARPARLPIWRLLDVAAPAMLLGQAIGRFG